MIAIVDYGMGNLASVYKALLYIGQNAKVTSDPDDLRKARAVILPGVGAMSVAMSNLRKAGLVDALYETVERQQPLMGICLGMQMLFETSEEGAMEPDSLSIADTTLATGQERILVKGLGILPGEVVKLPDNPGIKIPHMGWNQLVETSGSLYREGSSVYFVHSYHASPRDKSIITSKAHHGILFAASVAKGSICAMQFHPEKSGEVGLDILRAWVKTL
jgi:glutamine amidotransferase